MVKTNKQKILEANCVKRSIECLRTIVLSPYTKGNLRADLLGKSPTAGFRRANEYEC